VNSPTCSIASRGVNDTFGHHTGDAVLIDLAQHLRALTSNSWVAARLGGDEFACVTVGEPEPTRKRVDDLVASLRSARMISGLSVSVGSASTDLDHADSEQAILLLLRVADAEMYRFKDGRRARLRRDSARG
jgi:diguanylate cyclase (GGDEF)-like protein